MAVMQNTGKLTRCLAALACVASLAGCASEPLRQHLAIMERACAKGDSQACANVPAQRRINQLDANANANKTMEVIAVGLLLPLIVFGAAAGARDTAPQPVFVGCTRTGNVVNCVGQ